jgi:hypothetical protein
MKAKVILGMLLVSAVLAGQSFGLELLNDLLGINNGCSNGCCEPACCEKACGPVCCEKACAPACCEKTCCEPKCCEKACCQPKCCCEPKCCKPACEPACCEKECCETCCKSHCDLFAGLKGLFACKKGCCEPCGNACCEDTKCCAPEPKCCEKQCCEPACCEKSCCEPTCGTCCHKHHCTPVRDFLDDLKSLRICIYKAPCGCNTCGESCEESCGCGGGNTAPVKEEAPKTAPAKDLPANPPTADQSASLRATKYYQASRIVRN